MTFFTDYFLKAKAAAGGGGDDDRAEDDSDAAAEDNKDDDDKADKDAEEYSGYTDPKYRSQDRQKKIEEKRFDKKSDALSEMRKKREEKERRDRERKEKEDKAKVCLTQAFLAPL